MIVGGAGQSGWRSLKQWRQRVVAAITVGMLIALAGVVAQAATIVWGGGTGTFGTAANWVGGAAPGSSDTASFDGWIPLPTAKWTVTASNTGSDVVGNAFDGRLTTRWSTGTFQAVNMWFKVDLGASFTVSRLDIDANATSFPNDYIRGWSLAVSTNDSSYSTVATGTGSAALVSMTFSAQTARYIKVTMTSANATYWWGAAEITAYGPAAWVPLSTSGWTPTASRTGADALANSLDGDRATRWSTGTPMLTTDWYKVDMGSAKTFSRVEWDGNPGTWSCDYPPTWTLAVSNDNSTFTTVTTGSASVNITNSIFAAQTARYIKISSNATACGGGSWWGIAEFRVFTPTQATQLSRNGWTATASNTDGASPLGNSIDGNLATRWGSGLAQANGQWFKVDMTQSLTISAIVMDSYTNTNDYPSAWKLETSTDNSTFTTVAATQVPAGEYVAYQFAPRTARYVRITQTGSATNWWSIAEFIVYGTPVNASVSSSATVSAVNVAGSATLTQASGNTLTVSNDFTQSAGTFTGGNSLISVGGDFNLSGGTFTSTSDTLLVSGAFNKTGGTFTHHSGVVLLNSTGDQTFATNGATFYDLAINDGLVGYWKMDEGSGTAAVDGSGRGNDGVLTSTTWITSSLPTAINFKNNAGLSFNGTTSYMTVGTAGLPASNAAQTIAAWVNLTNNSASQYIISLWNSGSSGTSLGINGAKLSVWKWGPSDLVTVTPPATGGWHHVAYTFDGTTHKLYLDAGTPTTSTVAPNTLTPNNAQFGAFNSGPTFSGKLDDVRIYNRVLSATEINSLYIGNQPGTSVATQTMTGAPTVANDL
ncbi:MAG TPA: discoidin domain-containing protein, partial [Polyangia bacterium]|nr:discoidin domain-containing protein [Polyangia bacterium]